MNKELDLRTQIIALIDEVDATHRYSMSRIYDLYNQVFGTSELPQACASCLIRKVKQLKQWLADNPPADAPGIATPKKKVIASTSKKATIRKRKHE